MEIQFLGGASGVGATCQLVTLNGLQFLVDAGVRVDGTDRLPNLAALDGVPLAAILITHAHADHIGALPLVMARYPTTPIYASPATIRLMEVMLSDAARVMARRAAEELDLPLYNEELVAATLRRLCPLQIGAQSLAELPGIVVHAHRAGHIAGAVTLGFEAKDGRLVISGDVSATPQRTILGVAVPAPARPDLLVLESTYGARLHPNRTLEERALAESVATVIERGGHCLIPAFALGRAQEIILILRAAQRDGHIPPFPIAVDGLVRAVCAAYAAIPTALTPALARHIRAERQPFFTSTIRPVETPRHRQRIIDGPPSAIISSSGMLTGGPSVWYAERLVDHADAAIFFSGYLDEEAPGRRLLDLADAPPSARRLSLGDRTLNVTCQVGRYSLSAHADGDELAALVRTLQPKTVALVHGDPEARAALAARLHGLTETSMPQDGQTLTYAPSGRGGRRVVVPPPKPPVTAIGKGAPLDANGMEQLWTALRDGSGVQTLSVRDLARAWYGDTATPDHEQQVADLLEAGSLVFLPLPHAPGLWRMPSPTEVRRRRAAQSSGNAPAHGPRPDTNGIQTIIDHYLGHVPDLYQRSIDPATGAVTLRYFFPQVAQVRDADAIAQIAAEVGTPVQVWPHPHQGQLAATALDLLPTGLSTSRAPAIFQAQQRVEIQCEGQASVAAIRAAEDAFATQTGFRLVIQTPNRVAAPAPSNENGPALIVPPPNVPPVKVNVALAMAQNWFPAEAGCYKVGADQKAGILLLRFTFPDVVQDIIQDDLTRLTAQTGWAVQIWPQAHQQALMQAARDALPEGLTARGTPALHSELREVVLRVQGEVAPDVVTEATRQFTARTGWRLTLTREG